MGEVRTASFELKTSQLTPPTGRTEPGPWRRIGSALAVGYGTTAARPVGGSEITKSNNAANCALMSLSVT